MSGFYSNWIKVQHPNEVFPQMTSNGYQAPFYFGGSQVPEALATDLHESKHKTSHKNSQSEVKDITGKGVQNTTIDKHSNIMLPRHMSTIKK